MPETYTVNVSKEVLTEINDMFIQSLKDNGLVLLPEKAAHFANSYYQDREKVLLRDAVTPNDIIKYDLLEGVKSSNTVRNWVTSGRIREDECFKTKTGILKVKMSAIKRLNKA
jgi:hypothetical protein